MRLKNDDCAVYDQHRSGLYCAVYDQHRSGLFAAKITRYKLLTAVKTLIRTNIGQIVQFWPTIAIHSDLARTGNQSKRKLYCTISKPLVFGGWSGLLPCAKLQTTYEQHHEKTCFLNLWKRRHISTLQLISAFVFAKSMIPLLPKSEFSNLLPSSVVV